MLSALLTQDVITSVNKDARVLMFDEHLGAADREIAPPTPSVLLERRYDGGDLPGDVAPSLSIRKAEPRLDTQLREEMRSSSRSRQGEQEEQEEEEDGTAMMLGRERERWVTQAFTVIRLTLLCLQLQEQY